MKNKAKDMVTVLLFCGFLTVMASMYFFMPKSDFSENEKRYLTEFPKVEWDTVASGDWGNQVENYLADHIPGRNFFVGLNAYFDLFTGRQSGKSIYISGQRLVEAPVIWNEDAVERNMTAIHSLAEISGCEMDLMIVPSAGWATGVDGYQDDILIRDIYSTANSQVRTVDITGVFSNHPELFFKTDHHWNSAGAYEAYRYYMELCGKPYLTEDKFTIETVEEFKGSTYSRSALWLTPAEQLEIWHGSKDLTVCNGESEEIHTGVVYRERLQEADKYTVFLDGNHSIVRVCNPNARGRILVIRDSYSNLLGCFLAESYEEVVLIDMRYYKQPISQIIAEEGFDDILICYSLSNFLTDTNFIWMR